MQQRHRLQDYLHFAGMFVRNRRRQKLWGRRFEAALRQGTYRMPAAAVVQLIPTEACNLRCSMCNQWGDNGYFLQGLRPVHHMEVEGLTRLVRGLDPRDSLISIHGGEPFVYRDFPKLLDLLQEKPFDVMFTTNGTLIERYLEPLSRIRNLALLLSIDGDEQTHDEIRGRGRFEQARRGLALLYQERRRRSLPLPMVVMSFVVCEFNSDAVEAVYEVARKFGAFALNFNMRWFLTEEIGQAYERRLKEDFDLKSSGAWRGWVSKASDHDYSGAARGIGRLKKRRRGRPPFVVTTPKGFGEKEIRDYFSDYLNVFGNESCFMPFYWARVHANGDLIYCPGHPDIIAGNVFRDGLLPALNSETSIRFRKHILNNRFPICNRCCGLYMTYPARSQERRVRRKMGLSPAIRFDLS